MTATRDDMAYPDGQLTVLLSLAPPDGTTRFVDQLTSEADPRIRYLYFSWHAALSGRYDVLHLHWPEFLIRSRHWPLRQLRMVLLRMLLRRIRRRRTAVVRTLHNIKPHESGNPAENRLLRQCEDATTLYIRLNEATPLPAKASHTILHGHYRGRYRAEPPRKPLPGRVLYFGLIRPYKGVETLLDQFRRSQDSRLSLRVVGNPTSELRSLVEARCAEDARITADLRFVPDDVLAGEVQSATLVVLPYREMHNSGTILVALSLNRPVLVPRSESNALLAEEVGLGWIHMYEGEFDLALLERTLRAVEAAELGQGPNLGRRDWDLVGRLHYDAYLAAARAAKA